MMILMPSTICCKAGPAATLVVLGAVALAAGCIQDPGVGGGQPQAARSAPSPDTVVLELGDEAPLQQLLEVRKRLEQRPDDADLAAEYVERALRYQARTGDARFLGFAETALAPWQDEAQPPPAIWLLRGRLRQTEHRFHEAADDLDALLTVHPDSVEARLLAADAWRRAGKPDRSRDHCMRLAFSGRDDLARYCTADYLLSLGRVEQALRAVSQLETDLSSMQPTTAQWSLGVTAEVMAAAGRHEQSRTLYARALAMQDAGISLYAAYADLLLEMAEPQSVLSVLSDAPDADAVLLRRVIAARALDDRRLFAWQRRLEQRFEAAESLELAHLHLRERALFALHVQTNPASALALAADNWKRQKGPEDAALLIASAHAARQPEAARVVHQWRSRFVGKDG